MTANHYEVDLEYHLEHASTIAPIPAAPPFPILSDTPSVHPDSCLALSVPLLNHLRSLLSQEPDLVLSIGSGTGLLEYFLLNHASASPQKLNILGVEVYPSPNIYLPPPHNLTVIGTWSLHPLAGKAKAWLFVYPKQVTLVERYLKVFGADSAEMVVWIGPRSDWDDYKHCFDEDQGRFYYEVEVRGADEVGGSAWELIAVARKADLRTDDPN
ncbi:hypothetical protein K469DRAFT_711611 [Zopfia rhizophila CBS 207.26]|uniref:Uncharacterized protein n=1 Tax=Zopfia rhizophila CBS 207.26 TaxID=1314779 RepID=A0A6A6DZ30_9PEZI|nr:hypothetical protein K469DRAFT_711611 [Zopfia rhizophila CBS 207.26]